MSLMNILVKEEGVYKVTMSLHVIDDNESSRMIHNSECFFYLSKEWKL